MSISSFRWRGRGIFINPMNSLAHRLMQLCGKSSNEERFNKLLFGGKRNYDTAEPVYIHVGNVIIGRCTCLCFDSAASSSTPSRSAFLIIFLRSLLRLLLLHRLLFGGLHGIVKM